MDFKLELVAIPVSDPDRAKEGSACSIALGEGLTNAATGSARGMQLGVDDIEAVRKDLSDRGIPPDGNK